MALQDQVVHPSAYVYPRVTEELLQEVVRRILAVGNPLRIVLFGSQARGDAHVKSDLDILIVEESSKLPGCQRATPYRLALCGVYPSKDIEVWTRHEIEEWAAVPFHFVTTALREGRTLYEKHG